MINPANKKFIKSNIIVTAISLLSVGINFVSQMVLAYFFGAGSERDAYFSAVVIPTYVVTLFLGSFTVVMLPFYVEYKRNNVSENTKKLISSAFGLCSTLLMAIAIAGFLFSRDIVSLVAPGFSPDQLYLTGQLFEILIFSIIFQALTSFLSIFYHTEGSFVLPAVSPVLVPVVSLLFVISFANYGIKSLAVGTLVGSAIGMFVLLRKVLIDISIKHFCNFLNPETLKLLKLSLPLFVSGAVFRLTTVAERIIASELPAGSISYLGYSSQIYLLLAGIASGSIATTFYPLMSEAWSEGNRSMLNDYLSKGVRLILFITLPIAAILVALSYPIIEILFERGAFDAEATAAVSKALSILMGAFIFGSLGNIIVKLFYITKKTVSISVICIVEVLVYVVVGYTLSRHYSYVGLAIALTISTGVTILFSVVALSRSKVTTFTSMYVDVIKLFIAAALCGLAGKVMFEAAGQLGLDLIIKTALGGLVSLITYLIIITYVMKFPEARNVANMIRNYF